MQRSADENPYRFLRIRAAGDRAPGTLELTLDHPPVNVFHLPMIEELSRAIAQLEDAPPKTLIITSAWPRVFSAGVSVQDHFPESLETMLSSFHQVCRQLFELPTTTLALVRGGCLGGAMELVSCCDFIVAESTAWFRQPEIELGCFAPWAAAWYPTWLGPFRTNPILHLAEKFDAEKAQSIGLVYRIVPEGQGPDAARRLASRLDARSRVAAAALKRSLASAAGPGAALPRIESIYREQLTSSRDMREGLTAFVEKRRPRWTDS